MPIDAGDMLVVHRLFRREFRDACKRMARLKGRDDAFEAAAKLKGRQRFLVGRGQELDAA